MAPPPQGAMETCLDDDVIAGFVEASLSKAERSRATAHLSTCKDCRELMTAMARVESDEPESYRSLVFDEEGQAPHGGDDAAELVVGSSLGRYILLGKVGTGGMGVVYSAFDPELDRRIAVKVIRSEVAAASVEAKEQLRQEARAMARLTHPNVVRVYDVGQQGELVYIAMEYVDGTDLARYAANNRDDWRKVFDACIQAGRGLIAAHDAGLVHRDFKPSNVLCAHDGRVLVADFGLTRLLRTSFGQGGDGKTRAAGTPGYVAPEQARGQASTDRSDQYSYCVTLSQCLLGQEPSGPGSSAPETAENIEPASAERRETSDSRSAIGPRRLRAVLKRGMAADATERYPGMHSLLAQLQKAANRRRRNGIILISLAGAASIGVLMFVLGQRASSEPAVCANSAAPVQKIWSPAKNAALLPRLESGPYAGHTDYFLSSLDTTTKALSTAHSSACAATFTTRIQSVELYDRQMLCLGSQLAGLQAIVALVEGGGSVEKAQSALSKLAEPIDCQPNEGMLNAEAPPRDPELRRRIGEVEILLAKRNVMVMDNQNQAALGMSEHAIAEAEAIGYGPLASRAHLAYGKVLVALEKFTEAARATEKARDLAAKSRDDRLLIRALMQLADIAAMHQDNAPGGAALMDTAKAISSGLTVSPHFAALLHRNAAVVARIAEDPKTALAEVALGLAKLEENADSGLSFQAMDARISLLSIRASAEFDAGNYEAGEAGFVEIVNLQKRRLGPKHSGMATSLINLATMQYKLGKLEQANATLEEARERLKSPDASRSSLARSLNVQGLILKSLERPEDAAATYREAIEVQTEVYGADHRSVWSTKNNLANVLVSLEQWEEAIALGEAQVLWSVERGGKDNPKAITAAINLANTLAIGGASDEELTRATQIIDELLPRMPADDRRRVNVLSIRGQTLFRREKYRESAAAYAASIALADKTPNVKKSLLAFLYTRLAESHWNAGEKKKALAEAGSALALYEILPEKVEARKELEAWVSERKEQL